MPLSPADSLDVKYRLSDKDDLRERVQNYLERIDFSSHAEVPRPESALSGGSSFTNASDTDTEASISNREVSSIVRRDGNRCSLCHGTEDLYVLRLIWHEDQPHDSSVKWMQALRMVDMDFTRNDRGNLITICAAHGEQYLSKKWRFIPSRRNLDAIMMSQRDDARLLSAAEASRNPHPPRNHPQFTDEFEVFITWPNEGLKSAAIARNAQTGEDEYRVFHLPVNPYVALVSGMEVANGVYRPFDEHTEIVEDFLKMARNTLNTRFHIPILHPEGLFSFSHLPIGYYQLAPQDYYPYPDILHPTSVS